MTGQPTVTQSPGDPASHEADLAYKLRSASDAELTAILEAADDADVAMHQPGALTRPVTRAAPGTAEVVLLGALGCRYGMLAGGAGGYLLRTPATSILVDPGPAALGILATAHGTWFSWTELDAVACTHFHPDHYTGIIPCLEAMASHAAPGSPRKLLLANPTTTARFTAFSPYHAGGMADVITLAHPATEGHGELAVKVGDLTVHAVPAAHTEEAGRHRAAIGLAFATSAGGIWHTSDTTLADGLLEAVADILPDVTLVIAHADASNLSTDPARAAVCHLQSRDVLPIVTALQPRDVIIQHYDAAYSAPAYRIAQAVWLQRQLDRASQSTRVVPGINGLHVTLDPEGICGWDIPLTDPPAPAISSYLQAVLGGRH
ncbi:MAG: MBL fold metallo-hydrolase [Streptosporangiaceae bacterium]|nr:MBL fold metallo-hydrolase [Streptosporangiaceae bacterium]